MPNNIRIFLQSSNLLTNAYEPGWGGGGWAAAPPPQNLGNLDFLGSERNLGKAKSAHVYVRVFFFCSKRGIFHFCNRVGQMTIKDINFTRIFKVSTKLPESRSDKGNVENFENTSEINP